MDEITEMICKISREVEETQEEFIFTTILRYLEVEEELPKLRISKRLLKRAMMCFAEEHKEEYERLRDMRYEE